MRICISESGIHHPLLHNLPAQSSGDSWGHPAGLIAKACEVYVTKGNWVPGTTTRERACHFT